MKKKMMTVEEFLASKSISKEQFDNYTAEEIAKVYNELNQNNVEAFNELKEQGASKEELSEALKKMNEQTEKQLEKVLLAVEKQGIAIAKMVKKDAPKDATLKDLLAENKDILKNIAKRATADELALKADTNIASIATNSGAYEVSGVGQLGHKKLTASTLFPVINISNDNMRSTVRYYDWDEATTVRAAAMIAEGGTFPESTAKWKGYELPVKKIGDTLPVTEEFFEDEQMFASELQLFLITNVDIKIDDQIVNGDGTGNNLTGLVASVPAYTPVASGITDASIYDLLVKVSENITTNRGSKYMPDFALMNIADINKMKLKKDANNNYVLPPFVSRDGKEVSGMVIVEDNHITANTMIVGDRKYAKIYQAAGLTVSRGEVDAQFVEDMMTLKVRKRLAFLIREVDKTGFRKVTSISAALTTLAS